MSLSLACSSSPSVKKTFSLHLKSFRNQKFQGGAKNEVKKILNLRLLSIRLIQIWCNLKKTF